MTHFRRGPLTQTLYVVEAEDEVRTLDRLEFVMMSHTGVSRRKDALIIGDNPCSALLIRARMISPTRCGSRVQNSALPGMLSKTFCNIVGSPVR